MTLFVHLVTTVELWLDVTHLTSKGCYEPPLMSVELWQSHDEFQPVPAVVLPTVRSVFPEHVFEIPELTELSLAAPVLMIQQPATLHSPAADSVTHRILNRISETCPIHRKTAGKKICLNLSTHLKSLLLHMLKHYTKYPFSI